MYILYDPTCMDRLKYDYVGTTTTNEYIGYAIKISDSERLFLEVGPESTDYQARIPGNIKACSSPDLNKNLVSQINTNGDRVYMVRKAANGYAISPINVASYLQTSGGGVNFISRNYAFQYHPSRNSINENLAARTADVRVYYVGTTNNNCLDAYLFQAVPQFSNASYTDVIVIPEIGVIEDRGSATPTNKNGSSRKLTTVNGTDFQAYVNDLCMRRTNPSYAANTNPVNTSPSSYDNALPLNNPTTTNNTNNTVANTGLDAYTPYYDSRPTTTTPSPTVNNTPINNSTTTSNYGLLFSREGQPTEYSERGTANQGVAVKTAVRETPCEDIPNDGIHVVQKGETLYRISKLNNITVNQLKSWNGITSNTIYPCTKLYVVPPAQYEAVGGDLSARGYVNANTLATPKQQPVVQIHIVQPNETLSDIARRYGFTEERFRSFNNLLPTDYIYVGQQLKTTDCICPPATNTGTHLTPTNPTPNTMTTNSGLQQKGVVSDIPASYDNSVPLQLQPKYHIVKDNETLYSIAQQYNTTVNRLQELNNMEGNEVVLPAQRIYVR